MSEKKKGQPDDTWSKMENPMSILGKFSWLIALGAAIVNIVQGILIFNTVNYYNQMILAMPGLTTYYQALIASVTGSMVWYFICAGMTIVLIFVYVVRFSTKCAAKDWESLIADKLGGGFPKMWLMWILLAIFSYWGCVGVAIPVIMLTFVGPGKGRVFGKK
ncbi:MAG: hypothetical protein GYA24_19330 [Candidatus Lokiarchaeota archaeon]|nr:hypothetical protein [Candidatus Lokiarchaeota archaeon]